MKVKKYFQINESKFEIEIEKDIMGNLIVPIYAKTPPENKILNMLMSVDESNFDEDLKALIPDTLEGNWIDSCYLQLQKLTVSHFIQYARVLPVDLEAYCSESMLVIISIGEGLSQPLSLDQKRSTFKQILTETSNDLKVPLTIPL